MANKRFNKQVPGYGFKRGGQVIKTIAAPLTHLRNLISARAFKKANKKKK